MAASAARWPRVELATPGGLRQAIAPAVITASRATDIPAFHRRWFLNRLSAGWCRWDNPFGGPAQYVSFERLRAVVLFTKDPGACLALAGELERRELAFYVHATLNDYEAEGWEPGVPPLERRVRDFADLSRRLGRERVIWRFDPLLYSRATPPSVLLTRVEALGERLHPFTARLVFSFAHLERYAKVRRNLTAAEAAARSFRPDEMREAAGRLADLGRMWGLTVASCGEEIDLSAEGIARNRCVDPDLLLRLAPDDTELLRLYAPNRPAQASLPGVSRARHGLGHSSHSRRQHEPLGAGALESVNEAGRAQGFPKDPGQRKACGCAPAKDIGAYTTCGHGCVYCYANSSPEAGRRNAARVDAQGESLNAKGR